MEFFIAFFGIIYLSAILLNHKADERISKRNKEEWDNRCDIWKNRLLANPEYCRAKQWYVFSKKNVDEIYAELEDNLKPVFGDDYRVKFPIPGTRGYINYKMNVRDNALWTKYLLLSKEGKVPSDVFYPGYPIGGTYEKDITIPLCHQIELNLQQFYPEIELVMRPSYRKNQRGEFVDDNWNPCGKKLQIKQVLWDNVKCKKLW